MIKYLRPTFKAFHTARLYRAHRFKCPQKFLSQFIEIEVKHLFTKSESLFII